MASCINGAILNELDNRPLLINSLENYIYIIPNVAFNMEAGNGYPAHSLFYYSPCGTIYITNYRFIFVNDIVSSHSSSFHSSKEVKRQFDKFQSFVSTFNLIKDVKVERPWWSWFPWNDSRYLIAHMIPSLHGDNNALLSEEVAKLTLHCKRKEELELLETHLKNMQWTGHVNREESMEPLPRYEPPENELPAYDNLYASSRG